MTMTMTKPARAVKSREIRSAPGTVKSGKEAGFTLIEAIFATAILAVGLVAISNLMVVAITSNSLGNRISVAAFLASQKMEQLRTLPFDNPSMADSAANSLDVDQANFNEDVTVAPAGRFHTRWTIQTVGAFGTSLKYLAVRTESTSPAGRLTRADFTTFRACTLTGCTP